MSLLVLHFYVRGSEELESRLAATEAAVQLPLQADGRFLLRAKRSANSETPAKVSIFASKNSRFFQLQTLLRHIEWFAQPSIYQRFIHQTQRDTENFRLALRFISHYAFPLVRILRLWHSNAATR